LKHVHDYPTRRYKLGKYCTKSYLFVFHCLMRMGRYINCCNVHLKLLVSSIVSGKVIYVLRRLKHPISCVYLYVWEVMLNRPIYIIHRNELMNGTSFHINCDECLGIPMLCYSMFRSYNRISPF